MAEKPWYEKLLKTNPNLNLKDVIEYKIADTVLLAERVVADKVAKLKEGIAKGILPESALETGEQKAKEEVEKNRYKYDLESLASRIERDCPTLFHDREGNKDDELTGKAVLDSLLDDPGVAMSTVRDPDTVVKFFMKEFTIPEETMRGIILKKWAPTHAPALRRRKPVEPVEEVKEPETPRVEENLDEPEPAPAKSTRQTIVIKNDSDHSHLIRIKKSPNGSIQITLLPDARINPNSGKPQEKDEQIVHSRKRVQLYLEGSGDPREYDIGSTTVIL